VPLRLTPCRDFGDCSETRSLTQRVGAVGAFPGKTGAGAAKMPVGRGRLVDGLAQVERLNDGSGREREMLAHERGDLFFGMAAVPKCPP